MNNLKSYIGCFILIFGTGAVNLAAKNLTTIEKAQVEKLLHFVESSQCLFVRNGDEHSGKDAAKHIKRKFEHYENKINTVEKFIELSATKSSMSGKHYKIRCPEKDEMTSKNWLLTELEELRKAS